jgi:hypothetical protein
LCSFVRVERSQRAQRPESLLTGPAMSRLEPFAPEPPVVLRRCPLSSALVRSSSESGCSRPDVSAGQPADRSPRGPGGGSCRTAPQPTNRTRGPRARCTARSPPTGGHTRACALGAIGSGRKPPVGSMPLAVAPSRDSQGCVPGAHLYTGVRRGRCLGSCSRPFPDPLGRSKGRPTGLLPGRL